MKLKVAVLASGQPRERPSGCYNAYAAAATSNGMPRSTGLDLTVIEYGTSGPSLALGYPRNLTVS